jgi:hypothetical protein
MRHDGVFSSAQPKEGTLMAHLFCLNQISGVRPI